MSFVLIDSIKTASFFDNKILSQSSYWAAKHFLFVPDSLFCSFFFGFVFFLFKSSEQVKYT